MGALVITSSARRSLNRRQAPKATPHHAADTLNAAALSIRAEYFNKVSQRSLKL